MKNEKRQFTRLAIRATCAGLLICACLLAGGVLVPVRAQTPNLVDEWQWNSVGFSGRLRITTQNGDGTFSGEYIINYQSKIEGRIQGNQIEFVRRFTWTDGTQKEQRYKVTLVISGDKLIMNGTWTGFDTRTDHGGGDFSAVKVSGSSAFDISGTWNCTVNNGNFYRSRVLIHSAGQGKWNATATNLETSATFHQVLVGTSSEFMIRSLPGRPNQFFYNVSGPNDPNPSAPGPWSQAYTGSLDASGLHWQVVHKTADGRQATWPCECVRAAADKPSPSLAKITGAITDLNALFGSPHSSRLSTTEFPPKKNAWPDPSLTGHWTDKEDRNYSLIQPDWSPDTSNNQSDIHRGARRATLKLYTSEGGQFSGDCKVVLEFSPPEIKPEHFKIVESSIELEYQLQEGTVERRFPDWLKEMLVKQGVLGRMRLKGTLSADGKTISANYVDYDIEADPDTQTITKRKERLTPLVLTFQNAPCGPNEILAERERESKELGEFQSRLEKIQLSWEEQSLQASIISGSSIFEKDFDAINKARKLYNVDLQTWRKMEIDVVDKELPKNWYPYYGRRYRLLMTAYQKLEAVIEKSEPWRKKLAPLIVKFGDLVTDRLKDANNWRLSKRPAYYCITQDRILGPEAEKEYRKKYQSLFPVSEGVQYQARYELIVPPKPQLLPEDIPQGHEANTPIRHDLWSEEEVRELERDIENAKRAQEDMKFFVEHTELFGVIAEKLDELWKKHQ